MDTETKEPSSLHSLSLSSSSDCKLIAWKVCAGDKVRNGTPLASYTSSPSDDDPSSTLLQLKSSMAGVVKELLCEIGDVVKPE